MPSAMEYSEWQLTRLRNALRAFHKHGRHEVDDEDDGKRSRTRDRKFNWKYVAEEIWDAAGPGFLGLMDDRDTDVRRTRIKQFAERLRQFVEGNRNSDGTERRKFQRMQPDSLAAIVKFVTDGGLLEPDELVEHAPSTQAALRLLEYLDQGFDRIRTLPLLKFDGTYQARRKNDDEFIVLELTLERPSRDGMMQVTMTEEVFNANLEDKFDRWKPQERQEYRHTLMHYGGWAIFTPEENIMLFLKGPSQKNLYQFTLAADLEYRPDDPVQKLVLQHHQYPIELQDKNQAEPEMVNAVLQETAKHLVVFKRIA
ncbi:MAG TPA: hypothetical protein VEK14_03665 [Rhodomicrobium sp.]|nr:hypothetical protein [Rhodomicrobium sp.]